MAEAARRLPERAGSTDHPAWADADSVRAGASVVSDRGCGGERDSDADDRWGDGRAALPYRQRAAARSGRRRAAVRPARVAGPDAVGAGRVSTQDARRAGADSMDHRDSGLGAVRTSAGRSVRLHRIREPVYTGGAIGG